MSRQSHGPRRGWLMLLLVLMIPGQVQSAGFSEYDLKAAFVYNFASFTDWPPTASAGMSLCVIGQDPFGPSLDALEGKLVKGKSLTVHRISAIAEAKFCRVLFISESETARLSGLLASVKNLPVLTVADMQDAAQRGVMIGLAVESRRVTFEINTTATHSAGIALSSRLLKLARNVYPPP